MELVGSLITIASIVAHQWLGTPSLSISYRAKGKGWDILRRVVWQDGVSHEDEQDCVSELSKKRSRDKKMKIPYK